MTNGPNQPDSLDRDVTITGGEFNVGSQSGRPAGDTDASFGELQTGGDTRSSLSDLADLGGDEDGPQEVVDLESRYEILDVLGRGGMGEVVRAMDRRLKREVAIKRLRAELGASRQAMRRFLTEAVSVAALNHYNVVQIYDYGHTADGPFLVLELVEGPTLAERLQEGAFPLDDAVELTCQLCNGLQAAHDRGIVHRDIKPDNVLVTSDGTPKLTDFGLAREVTDTGMTRTGAVLGTLDYMSPEQKADSSQADARSDQWSVAATFYQMVTGEPPRIIDIDEVPASVRSAVRKALKNNPADRFDSVRLLGDALRNAVGQAPTSVRIVDTVPEPVSTKVVRTAPDPFDCSTRGRTAEESRAAQQAWADHLEQEVVETNSVGMNLALIPPGEFLMGSPDSDSDASDDERPRHLVRITQPFYLQTTEVTQAQWKAVMNTEPWKGEKYVRQGDDFAATYISWNDAQEFCRRLSVRDGSKYQLPTEAEWEYACRAGTTTRYYFGDNFPRLQSNDYLGYYDEYSQLLGEYAWFRDNTVGIDRNYAHKVGMKPSNAWGLYDMHGNVSEWCEDEYDGKYYQWFARKIATDPQGPSTGAVVRVRRGGGWGDTAMDCRAANRGEHSPWYCDVGLRVARVPPGN